MKLAITHHRLALIFQTRSRHRIADVVDMHFFALAESRKNREHWDALDPTRDMDIPVSSYFAGPYQKVTTQIPIALQPAMTAWPPPAVPSLEACQTPAR